jgi:hypothetical protein
MTSIKKKISKTKMNELRLENLFYSNKEFLKKLYANSVIKKEKNLTKTEFSLDQKRKSKILSDYLKGLSDFDYKIDRVIHNDQEKFLIDNMSFQNNNVNLKEPIIDQNQDMSSTKDTENMSEVDYGQNRQNEDIVIDDKTSSVKNKMDIGEVNQINKLIEKFIENDDSFIQKNDFYSENKNLNLSLILKKRISSKKNKKDSKLSNKESNKNTKSKNLSKIESAKIGDHQSELNYNLEIKSEELKSIFENFRIKISEIIEKYKQSKF